MLDKVDPTLTVASIGLGVVLALRDFTGGGSATVIWMRDAGNVAWPLSAFSAFGTMAGFSLAALALITSVTGHERMKEVLDGDGGRLLFRSLVRSTWSWMITAFLALAVLASLGTPRRVLEAVLVFFVVVSIGRSLVALVALTLVFQRFTVRKPRR